MRKSYQALWVCILAMGLSCAAAAQQAVQFTPKELALLQTMRLRDQQYGQSDPTNYLSGDLKAIRVGQGLFADRRIGSGNLACVDCHDPSSGWTATRVQATNRRGHPRRDPPSLFDAGQNRWYFRDGRVDTLWGQVAEALVTELGVHPESLEKRFLTDNLLNEFFDEKGVRYAGSTYFEDRLVFVAKSLAAYVGTIRSAPSSFDCFIASTEIQEVDNHYSMDAQRGLKIFLNQGKCATCHFGPYLTDGNFHNIGVPPLPSETEFDSGRLVGLVEAKGNRYSSGGRFSDDRLGRAAALLHFIRMQPNDAGAFRTPSLRNVALTQPYMHNGVFPTLKDVVAFYNAGGKGSPLSKWEVIRSHHSETIVQPLQLNDQEQASLVEFLKTLTSEAVGSRECT
ncbi:cytochrome c peroxidase [Mesorhizobium sp.]|uniref:cytochrome-c peroxidase n=1 Tax=Mesorhizobium sp. TaxID=1871066 RepID=UPI000FE825CE|nr:cytochrome c peroxidase [Mesorhizobium sp.]RWP37993.1 MAG: hypothetical protein EOR03_03570 [Mesorhizobium sp.]